MQTIYQESENGRFTHKGKKYNLNEVFKLTHIKPINKLKVSDLEWILEFSYEEKDGVLVCRSCRKGPAGWHEQRVNDADLNTPIIAIFEDQHWIVLDGVHRLQKAKNLGVVELPVKVIDDGELESCLYT
ncbi:MAG: hypothetical protein JNK26_04230 [Candidatus Doudnabacteria bacterium]|nr:hypothetical protein [Candidatus Doudnabacteria bacterium]